MEPIDGLDMTGNQNRQRRDRTRTLRILAAIVVAAGIGTAIATAIASAMEAADDPLPERQRRAIIDHGPWPPAPAPDPSNRVSDDETAATLGIRLFFDPRLAPGGAMSCATCHRPEQAFAEDLPVSEGRVLLTRNAPSLINIRFRRWFGRDGASDSLWAASVRPLLEEKEFRADAPHITRLLESDPVLGDAYREVFGGKETERQGSRLLANIGKSLAAFQETLISQPSEFDRYRDAIAAGESAQAALFPDPAKRGAVLFFGRGRCNRCHSGPFFSNQGFANTGIGALSVRSPKDPGRQDGIKRLRSSPYNLLGPHNDDLARSTEAKTRRLVAKPQDAGAFAIPSLRGVVRTPPYMHNGSLPTLESVVRHYSVLDWQGLPIQLDAPTNPLDFTDDEVRDLVAFLEML